MSSFSEESASSTERYIEVGVLSIIALVSMVGNVSLWIVVLSKRSFRTTTNAFVLCLSGADILVCTVNMPVTLVTLIVGRWPFSHKACVTLGFVTMLTFVSSVMSLGLISLDRYILVCHSSNRKLLFTRRRAGSFIAGVWLLSVILSAPPLLGWARYDFIPRQSFCFCLWTSDVSYAFFMIIMCFGGPFAAMSFCYVQILRFVRKVGQQLSDKGRNTDKHDPPERPTQKKIPSIHIFSVSSNLAGNTPRCGDFQPCKQSKYLSPPCKSIDEKMEKSTSFVNDSIELSCIDSQSVTSVYHGQNVTVCQTPTARVKKKKLRKTKRQQDEMHLTLSFFIVIVIFVMSWLPFCVTMILSVLGMSSVTPRYVDMLTLLLGYANSCYNPIVYGVMNKRFRSAYKSLFYCRKRRQ